MQMQKHCLLDERIETKAEKKLCAILWINYHLDTALYIKK